MVRYRAIDATRTKAKYAGHRAGERMLESHAAPGEVADQAVAPPTRLASTPSCNGSQTLSTR